MNIYELEKQATRRNNFMRATEALRHAFQILDEEYPAEDCRHPSQWGLDTLIKELEEV